MLEGSLSDVRVALLIKEERAGGTIAVNIVATSERADFSIAKETGARVKSQNLLQQAGIMTFAAKQARSAPGAREE